LVTVVTPRDTVTSVTTSFRVSGDRRTEVIHSTVQVHRPSVTSVTTVTTEFDAAGKQALDELRSMTPPESFGAEAWGQPARRRNFLPALVGTSEVARLE
jgi:hypothetical protein